MSSPTVQIRTCIDRLKQGDESARGELINVACGRLIRLTRQIKGDYAGVGRWEQTEDVFQNACLRLYESLARVQPADARHFFRLAAVQIRRELIDLARHYQGPHGLGAHHATRMPVEQGPSRSSDRFEPVEATQDPRKLAAWADFHETINTLPESEREVFDLLWYHGLSQDEAAGILEVDVRTVKRRWRAARLDLHAALGGELPGG